MVSGRTEKMECIGLTEKNDPEGPGRRKGGRLWRAVSAPLGRRRGSLLLTKKGWGTEAAGYGKANLGAASRGSTGKRSPAAPGAIEGSQ